MSYVSDEYIDRVLINEDGILLYLEDGTEILLRWDNELISKYLPNKERN